MIQCTYKATQSKKKKSAFSLVVMKDEVLCFVRRTPAIPTQTFFRLFNLHIFGCKNPFAFPPNDCVFLLVDFLSCTVLYLRGNNHVWTKLRSGAFVKFLYKICLKWKPTNCRHRESKGTYECCCPQLSLCDLVAQSAE